MKRPSEHKENRAYDTARNTEKPAFKRPREDDLPLSASYSPRDTILSPLSGNRSVKKTKVEENPATLDLQQVFDSLKALFDNPVETGPRLPYTPEPVRVIPNAQTHFRRQDLWKDEPDIDSPLSKSPSPAVVRYIDFRQIHLQQAILHRLRYKNKYGESPSLPPKELQYSPNKEFDIELNGEEDGQQASIASSSEASQPVVRSLEFSVVSEGCAQKPISLSSSSANIIQKLSAQSPSADAKISPTYVNSPEIQNAPGTPIINDSSDMDYPLSQLHSVLVDHKTLLSHTLSKLKTCLDHIESSSMQGLNELIALAQDTLPKLHQLYQQVSAIELDENQNNRDLVDQAVDKLEQDIDFTQNCLQQCQQEKNRYQSQISDFHRFFTLDDADTEETVVAAMNDLVKPETRLTCHNHAAELRAMILTASEFILDRNTQTTPFQTFLKQKELVDNLNELHSNHCQLGYSM